MLTITLNLSQKTEQQLEKDFQHLENLTGKQRDFHIEKAITRYLEHANKLIKFFEQERAKGNQNYTTEELLEHLNLKEVDWEK
jgi:hypothetical protein